MQRCVHLVFVVILLTGLAVSAALSRLPFNQRLIPPPVSWPARPGTDTAETAVIAGTVIDPGLITYLEESFCDGDLCRSGSWNEWLIIDPNSVWTVEELRLLHAALITTIGALNDAGHDGCALLSGYRFRRSQGIYLPGKLGQVALVQHDTRQIRLSDRALHTQSGFYIYHELGHVVDRRLDGALTRHFHRLVGSDKSKGKTANGFWLDTAARDRPQEATADAFALWVILNDSSSPEPVFWNKPEEAHYDTIAGVMDKAIQLVSWSVLSCQLSAVSCQFFS